MRRLLLLLSLIATSSFAGTSRYVDAPELDDKDRAALNLNFQTVDTELSVLKNKENFRNLIIKGPRPWVDARAYGAVGDDSHDDTTALVNAAAAATGGCLFLFNGTYKISGDIPLLSNTTVLGVGAPILKQYSTSNYTFVIGAGALNIKINGITFQSDSSIGGEGAAIQWNISNSATSTKRIWVEKCRFGPTLNMIGIAGGKAEDIYIRNNMFDIGDQGQHGIYIADCNNVRIDGNTITGPGAGSPTFPSSTGIKLIGCHYSVVTDNVITSWKDNGILVQHQSGTEYPTHSIISNNHIYLSTVGVSVADANDTTIAGNVLDNITDFGIIATSTGLSVTNNLIQSAGLYGNQIGMEIGGSDVMIQGNYVKGFVFVGLKVDTSSSTIIGANVFNGSSAARCISIDSGVSGWGLIHSNIFTGCTSSTVLNSKDYILTGNRIPSGRVSDSAGLIDSLQVGNPTGGDKGNGTVNVGTNMYKNNSAYSNP